MVKKATKPIKKVTKSGSNNRNPAGTKGIPPQAKSPKAQVRPKKITPSLVANKIIGAAKNAGVAHDPGTAPFVNPNVKIKPSPEGQRRVSAVTAFIEVFGIDNICKLREKVMEQALAGDWNSQQFILERIHYKYKPEHFMRQSIYDFITISKLEDYETNIAHIIELSAKGEIDLDDGELLVSMLTKGKDFKAARMLDELEERRGILESMAPARK